MLKLCRVMLKLRAKGRGLLATVENTNTQSLKQI